MPISSAVFDAVAQIFGFINPEPDHLSPVEQVSRIYSTEARSKSSQSIKWICLQA